MLDLEDDTSRREKCYTTITQLPAYIDPKQPPTKKSPFSAIQSHPYIHTVETILPEALYWSIGDSLDAKLQKPQYAKVFMSPASLLEDEFFNAYIKIGNILMISEGRSGTENVFSLRDGILRLELGKETFERTGLTGKPVRGGGRKHAKERYFVELNLRLPSMLHGKKGFERIIWAFQNVLTESVAWLFCDLASESNGLPKDIKNTPLQKHKPEIVECDVTRIPHREVLAPPSQMDITESTPSEDVQEHCNALSEWLAMIALESPRVTSTDTIDPYLSRYSVPDADDSNPTNLISLKWHGFINSRWITHLLTTLLLETSSQTVGAQSWIALSSNALGREAVDGRDGYTILSQSPNDHSSSSPRRQCICWEFVGASTILL
ncbi:ribonuclease P protein subunit p40 [Aspergillus ruber CBS 135680]|uniref:Uncharacterized protein n=1 Tax=Aspergillus ruber (strain CBS 135680) TaxID=1388766 RepID=A0A017S6Q7_ASPRC|nr:uncharacterized protein EURHEDRAFT_505772 [Aspergillus ruber CBS 135680]EYE92718.1 hypothetical protein EURHEDRAFT_505772 [Aspergillus ruber CBS 135680]